MSTAAEVRRGSGPHRATLTTLPEPTRSLRWAAALVTVVFALATLRMAWYGDDWLITLRTSLNAIHGNGLGYNPDERVAAYTHPLWFLLITLIGWLVGSWVLPVILVSVALATAAVAIMVFRVRSFAALLFIGLTVTLSNTILTWSTGGLEGALAAALVCLLIAWVPRDSTSVMAVGGWGVVASLIMLTRLDLLLLILPLLIWAAVNSRHELRRLLALLAGALVPLCAWLLFSWSYYGSALPNTFAAKTNVDIPQSEMIGQGLFYLWYCLRFDPLLAIAVMGALGAVVISRNLKAAVVLGGVGAYLAYVVWVGGDFMAGRFLYVPMVAALSAIVIASRGHVGGPPVWNAGFNAGSVILIVAAFATSLGLRTDTSTSLPIERGVTDERTFWLVAAHTNVFEGFPAIATPPAVQAMDRGSLEEQADAWQQVGPGVPRISNTQYAGLGYWGMRLGPAIHMIDLCALTDRFLALQTFVPSDAPTRAGDEVLYSGPGWRIGHYGRMLPEGYVEAIMWRDPDRLEDPALREELRSVWSTIRDAG